MNKMQVVFLAGAFWGDNKKYILEDSLGVVQNAADVLQKNYIEGLALNDDISSLKVINIPFVGSYPKRFKRIYYNPAVGYNRFEGFEVFDFGFLNVSIVKNISRFLVAFKSLLDNFKGFSNFDGGDHVVLVCYSMHLPFLLACYFLKIIKRKIKLCVIVPDLPEFMSVRHGLGALIYNSIAKISYFIVSRADCTVAITGAMLLKISGNRGVVIEGISSKIPRGESKVRERFFLYSGTLDSRYGIRELIDDFKNSNIGDVELRICGDGDMKKYVIEQCNKNNNIKYLGQIDRDEVLELQRKALALINPRKNSGEFTKYSFPSKIIEYMASGTPVVMYRLDGIPEEYFDYCYTVNEELGALSNALKSIALLPMEILEEKGMAAQKFICERKNSEVQVSKIVDYIKGNFNV